ncbi:hypothetical protein BDR07DRAFT_1575206 [Suillus spraguei]|nr:hypothetical protein BDR07DRAFT_1575206 [Suillus spraguei]
MASRHLVATDNIAIPSIWTLCVQHALVSICSCTTRRYLRAPTISNTQFLMVHHVMLRAMIYIHSILLLSCTLHKTIPGILSHLAVTLSSWTSYFVQSDACSTDLITSHDVPWQSLSLRHPDYEANLNNEDVPPWKHPRELLKNQLSNPEFVDGIDYALRQVFGNWAWNQCNTLAHNDDCHGAMFIPVILGSNKTTVSVTTAWLDFFQSQQLSEAMRIARNTFIFVSIYFMLPYVRFLNLFVQQCKSLK